MAAESFAEMGAGGSDQVCKEPVVFIGIILLLQKHIFEGGHGDIHYILKYARVDVGLHSMHLILSFDVIIGHGHGILAPPLILYLGFLGSGFAQTLTKLMP